MQLQPIDCDLARESVSAQLDGELPAFELDRLETHLLLCPDCSAWADDVRDLTLRLREATLETPAERFALPRFGRGWRVSSAVAVASAAALVATMFFAPGQSGSGSQGLPRVSGFVGARGQDFVVSRLGRLGDGVYNPASLVTSSHDHFRHV